MPNETTDSLALTDEQQDMVAIELELLKADRLAHRQERLPEWFLRKLKESDAVGEAIKQNYKGMLHELAMRRRAFVLEWGPEFRDVVKNDLADVNKDAKKPRKTIRYLTGQAGTRKSQDKLVVQDKVLAAKWAWENCKAACDIVLARTTPLLEHLKESREFDEQTGEEKMEKIPGCTFVASHDAPSPKLEELDALPAPQPPPVERPSMEAPTPDSPADSPGDVLAAPDRTAGDPF